MVRTLLVYGLPRDTKRREITNLLWYLPEFESAWLAYDGSKGPPVGVAAFSSARAAAAAVRALHYYSFDRDVQLRCELAVHDVAPGQLAHPQPLRAPMERQGMQNRPPLDNNRDPSVRRDRGQSVNAERYGKIFIGKLSSNVLEEDIKRELSQHQGFRALRHVARDGVAMCFVEFETPALAEEVVGFYSDGFTISNGSNLGVVEMARDKRQKRDRD